MSDDRNQVGAADRSRVNVNQEHELRYWTARFGCTADQLREVVARVGQSVSAVEAELSRGTGDAAQR
jgi:hypothetical protein